MPYPTKFVADAMLGSLARWLRAIGYDTVYLKDVPDREVVACALSENRTILTRDHHFESMKAVKYYILITSTSLAKQFQQVVDFLQLDTENNLLTRCVECNTILEHVDKEKIQNTVPPHVYKTKDRFIHCPGCGKIYWEGTHVPEMQNKIKRMLTQKP